MPPCCRRPGLLALALVTLIGRPGDARAQEPRLLFLNFSDGTTNLRQGAVDDARVDVTQLGSVVEYPPFYWPSVTEMRNTRQEVIDTVETAVHKIFLPYNLLVGTTRPAEGHYTTAMIGGTPDLFKLPPDTAGVAIMDCANRMPSNVVFAFPTILRGDLRGLIGTLAQEAAHAFGLEHTDDPRDVMYPTVSHLQRGFLDLETPIAPPFICGPRFQNSHQLLLQHLGPWAGGRKPLTDGRFPDIEAPVITIAHPFADGMVEAPIRVLVGVEDESPIKEVFTLAFGQRFEMTGPPYEVVLPGQPSGPGTVTVVAADIRGNQAVASVDFSVVPPEGGCSVGANGRPSGAQIPGLVRVLVVLGVICGRRRRAS